MRVADNDVLTYVPALIESWKSGKISPIADSLATKDLPTLVGMADEWLYSSNRKIHELTTSLNIMKQALDLLVEEANYTKGGRKHQYSGRRLKIDDFVLLTNAMDALIPTQIFKGLTVDSPDFLPEVPSDHRLQILHARQGKPASMVPAKLHSNQKRAASTTPSASTLLFAPSLKANTSDPRFGLALSGPTTKGNNNWEEEVTAAFSAFSAYKTPNFGSNDSTKPISNFNYGQEHWNQQSLLNPTNPKNSGAVSQLPRHSSPFGAIGGPIPVNSNFKPSKRSFDYEKPWRSDNPFSEAILPSTGATLSMDS
jgi:hypothetical protein